MSQNGHYKSVENMLIIWFGSCVNARKFVLFYHIVANVCLFFLLKKTHFSSLCQLVTHRIFELLRFFSFQMFFFAEISILEEDNHLLSTASKMLMMLDINWRTKHIFFDTQIPKISFTFCKSSTDTLIEREIQESIEEDHNSTHILYDVIFYLKYVSKWKKEIIIL